MQPSNPSIRPALCSVGSLYGGVERQLLDLVRYLRRRDVDPRLVLFFDRELASQAKSMGIDTVVFPVRRKFDPRSASGLARILAESNINLVHTHGYKAMVMCALARRRHPFAIVNTVHGIPEPAPRLSVGWSKVRVYRSLERIAARQSGARVCFVTDDLRRRLSGGFAGLSQATVHNGIDPVDARGHTRPAELAAGAFHLVLAGRIDAVKGIEFALQAMASPEMPRNAFLHVLGTGPLLNKLRATSETRGLSNRVRFLGFRRDALDFLAHCDAVLMPSLYEGLSYTLLEAMSLGRPILASRVGGLQEVLDHEKSALLFPPRDPGAIVEAAVRLEKDPVLAETLGAEAARVQRELYSLDAMGDAYWSIYEDAVSRLD